jgi:hypothetical protein
MSDAPNESADSLRECLVSYKDACEVLTRATFRRGEIPALGEIVRKKSSEAMDEYWRVNKEKNDADRPPYPQVSDISEQREIEKINHDVSTAQHELAIQRSSLLFLLAPLGADPRMTEAQEICRRPDAFTNDVLIALVEKMTSTSKQPTRRRSDSPSTALRNNLIRQALDAGESRAEICQMLDKHKIPTTENMQSSGIVQWATAWDDPDFKKNVQQLFSKERQKLSSP